MTSQDPTDPPRTSTDPARRAGWGIGALVVVVLIVAAVAYAMNRALHRRQQAARAPRNQRPAAPARVVRQTPERHDNGTGWVWLSSGVATVCADAGL
jgi:hypothetical protein